MATGRHDEDHVPVLLATSSTDGITPVVVWADPVTHRLLTSSSGSATTTVYTETPSGAIDGVNTTYTVLHTINNIFSFAINGMYLHPYDGSVGDYTFTGDTLTFVSPIPASLSGTAFTLVYQ